MQLKQSEAKRGVPVRQLTREGWELQGVLIYLSQRTRKGDIFNLYPGIQFLVYTCSLSSCTGTKGHRQHINI